MPTLSDTQEFDAALSLDMFEQGEGFDASVVAYLEEYRAGKGDSTEDVIAVENMEALLNALTRGEVEAITDPRAHSPEYLEETYRQEVFATAGVMALRGDETLRRDFPQLWAFLEKYVLSEGEKPVDGDNREGNNSDADELLLHGDHDQKTHGPKKAPDRRKPERKKPAVSQDSAIAERFRTEEIGKTYQPPWDPMAIPEVVGRFSTDDFIDPRKTGFDSLGSADEFFYHVTHSGVSDSILENGLSFEANGHDSMPS